MEYPFKSKHRSEEYTTTFVKGKFYKCILSNSKLFSTNRVYMCVSKYGKSYLVSNNFSTTSTSALTSKFVEEV